MARKTPNTMIWDNGGKTADRYTVVVQDPYSGFHIWNTSEWPDHPQGVGSYVGHFLAFNSEPFWGKRSSLKKAPKTLKRWIGRIRVELIADRS